MVNPPLSHGKSYSRSLPCFGMFQGISAASYMAMLVFWVERKHIQRCAKKTSKKHSYVEEATSQYCQVQHLLFPSWLHLPTVFSMRGVLYQTGIGAGCSNSLNYPQTKASCALVFHLYCVLLRVQWCILSHATMTITTMRRNTSCNKNIWNLKFYSEFLLISIFKLPSWQIQFHAEKRSKRTSRSTGSTVERNGSGFLVGGT